MIEARRGSFQVRFQKSTRLHESHRRIEQRIYSVEQNELRGNGCSGAMEPITLNAEKFGTRYARR